MRHAPRGDHAPAMILGVGIDTVAIKRIAALLQRHGDRFRNRVYTPGELRAADQSPDPAATLAKRWAAKEACSKALGTGLRHGVAWRGMEVITLGAQPQLALSGGAKARATALTPDGCHVRLHLSMSDDPPMATAIVLLEAVPA